MASPVATKLVGHNPDVLSCIANLSSDEVFTPPAFANRMLDSLERAWADGNDGASIWSNSSVRFLDPFCKSGIFLREIVKRLTSGLADEIPDLEQRVNHILENQVFGIATTTLTSMISRRSIYCSKSADGKHSIATGFGNESGRIWFERTEHVAQDGRCRFCGAGQVIIDRDPELESHAYAFIHADDIGSHLQKMFGGDMEFDVIVGNPPYHMTGGGGGSNDSSIYDRFVMQAIKLDPRYICMVIPSRWMAGGRDMDEFRSAMLTDSRVVEIVDWKDSSEAFPGVSIKGGICYFLWGRDHDAPCVITQVAGGVSHAQAPRPLSEFDVLIRDEKALSILRKVADADVDPVSDMVSGDTPFGIATNFTGFSKTPAADRIELHLIEGRQRSIGYVERAKISKNSGLIDSWKVFLPKAYGAGESYPHQILGRLIVGAPGSICTQTYVVAAPFETEVAANSFASYYSTRLFRFLASLRKITQDAPRGVYSWVPQLPWDRIWTDEALRERYEISDEEWSFIESMIRPMELDA